MRTPQLSWADLEPVTDRLSQTGGELAVGILDDSSNASLARVRIDEPPIAPEPPKEVGNVWYGVQDGKKYGRDSLAHAEERRGWLENAERKFARLSTKVDSLLARPADARFTDVWGAISRAAYFLDEPGRWRCEPLKVAILVSDAIDNMGAPSVPWPPTAELYLVNGTPSLGALEQLNPVRFESIEAAFRYVVGASPMEGR